MYVCTECASQSQEFEAEERADADNMSLGTIAIGRTRRKGNKKIKTESEAKAAERIIRERRMQVASADKGFGDEELLSGLQAIVKAQAQVRCPAPLPGCQNARVLRMCLPRLQLPPSPLSALRGAALCQVLVKTFGCSPELPAGIRDLWFRYAAGRAGEQAAQRRAEVKTEAAAGLAAATATEGPPPQSKESKEGLPEPELQLSLCFCILGCWLGKEPMTTADVLRAATAGSLPYVEATSFLPAELEAAGKRAVAWHCPPLPGSWQ